MARADCPKCDGTGWKIVEGGIELSPAEAPVPSNIIQQAEAQGEKAFALGSRRGAGQGLPRVAVLCDCAAADHATHTLERARLPHRYQHCDFENFEADLPYDHSSSADLATWNRSLDQAKIVAQGFARGFPAGTEHGLLLMGPCGVGKTHLAVAALREIVVRGHSGLFYDYRELLKEIQDSYNVESQSTEMAVLEPVLTCDVLLLDDLGASKPSLWTLETVGHILNSRYNDKRATLITTNFLDAESVVATAPRGASNRSGPTEDTLTDRVGKRIRSRLYEMCRTVEMVAPDYRKEIRQATRFRA
jgi:DNA replication protein DnaC